MMSYQGYVRKDGNAFTGPTGFFKFALVDPGTDMSVLATAQATVTSGFITGIDIIDGGFGYSTPPEIVITDSTGSGAMAQATVLDGVVVNIAVLNAGIGYSPSPTVSIAAPAPSLTYQTYWSNDGTSLDGSEPAAAVSATVSEAGLFSVMLGDAGLANMLPIPLEVFLNPEVRLRVWFDEDGVAEFTPLEPDQPIGSVGYAMVAGRVGEEAIDSVNLVNEAVSNDKLAGNAVTTEKILNGSIALEDLGTSVLGAFWGLGGNAGTTEGEDFLGTTDNHPLEFRVNNQRALRLEGGVGSVNVLGGAGINSIDPEAIGVTIAGGGWSVFRFPQEPIFEPNTAGSLANYGSIGGGYGNAIDARAATIGGGRNNMVLGFSVIGIDFGNDSTVGGGQLNTVTNADQATIGGGLRNTIGSLAHQSVIAGGEANVVRSNVTHAAIGGGELNSAGGDFSTVPGGNSNQAAGDYSLAAGRRAKANHTGAFVWADSANADFASTANDQFLIRATGGVGIGTTSPSARLHVEGNTRINGDLYVAGAERIKQPLERVTYRFSPGGWSARTDVGDVFQEPVGYTTALMLRGGGTGNQNIAVLPLCLPRTGTIKEMRLRCRMNGPSGTGTAFQVVLLHQSFDSSVGGPSGDPTFFVNYSGSSTANQTLVKTKDHVIQPDDTYLLFAQVYGTHVNYVEIGMVELDVETTDYGPTTRW